jgi:uncharacterized peroxidase-related enzyme
LSRRASTPDAEPALADLESATMQRTEKVVALYTVLSAASAPERSRTILAALEREVGFVPNLAATMAASPVLVEAFTSLRSIYRTSTLTPIERELVELVAAFESGCAYCMAAHSTFAAKAGASVELLTALRNGQPPADDRLRALYTYARHVVQGEGRVAAEEAERLVEAGYSAEQALDVLVGVAISTLASQTYHLASTAVDAPFQPQRWEHPQAS